MKKQRFKVWDMKNREWIHARTVSFTNFDNDNIFEVGSELKIVWENDNGEFLLPKIIKKLNIDGCAYCYHLTWCDDSENGFHYCSCGSPILPREKFIDNIYFIPHWCPLEDKK